VVRHVKAKRSLRVVESMGMLLLDVEKAFDSVWHEALLDKLLVNGGCGICVVRLILLFLKNRSIQVCIGGSKSSCYDIPYGVPQGAILSLTLCYIISSHPISQPQKNASLPHLLMILLFLCQTQTRMRQVTTPA
jgi:hypothetical protein